MNKNKKNKDWEPWQESLVVFFATLGLILIAYYNYSKVVHEESIGTKGKVLQHLFKYLDKSFGKEYVFAFLGLILLLTGIKALRGYMKHKKDKADD